MDVAISERSDIRCRPRRQKVDKTNVGFSENMLELDGVFDVLKSYKGCDGGANCSICGKLYKSRVCLIKHLWEHTVYWKMFTGQKNQDRVLSIQAALILYGGSLSANNIFDSVSSLLVTSPNGKDDKSKDHDESDILKPSLIDKKHKSPCKRKSPLKSNNKSGKRRLTLSDSDMSCDEVGRICQ